MPKRTRKLSRLNYIVRCLGFNLISKNPKEIDYECVHAVYSAKLFLAFYSNIDFVCFSHVLVCQKWFMGEALFKVRSINT